MTKKKSILPPEIAIVQIDDLINRSESIISMSYKASDYILWRDEIMTICLSIFERPQLDAVRSELFYAFKLNYPNAKISSKEFKDIVVKVTSKLKACRKSLLLQCEQPTEHKNDNALDQVLLICSRFKQMAIALRERGRGREPLIMRDEYDVQYLLNSLLSLCFDKISAEEQVPSCAYKNTRIDFLLKDEKIAIEVKTTLKENPTNIQSQLLEDISCYPEHPDVKTLVCFIYDPDSIIQKKKELVEVLNSKSTHDVKVITIVCQ